jgi:hypothetical protein
VFFLKWVSPQSLNFLRLFATRQTICKPKWLGARWSTGRHAHDWQRLNEMNTARTKHAPAGTGPMIAAADGEQLEFSDGQDTPIVSNRLPLLPTPKPINKGVSRRCACRPKTPA